MQRDNLQQWIKDLEQQVRNLEERIDEIESVTIHEQRKMMNIHARQFRTIFFGFTCVLFVFAGVYASSGSQDEKYLYALGFAFGSAAIANTTGALDSVAGDLLKSLKK
jgi:hypothetical protein